MNARNTASRSGSGETSRQKRKRRDSCAHHWILSNTKYPIVEGSGQTNIGGTKGRCKKCDKKRGWETATPDSVHGMESLIASSLRLEEGELLEGFHELEGEDYDA